MRFVSKKAGGVVTCEEDRQKKRGYGRKVVVGGGKRGTLGSLGTHVATSKFSHVQQIAFVVVVLAVVLFFFFFSLRSFVLHINRERVQATTLLALPHCAQWGRLGLRLTVVLWLAYFTINFSGPPALYINFAFQFAFCYAPPISGSATAEWSGRKTEREGERGESERRGVDPKGDRLTE